jgi:hypothetical protein
MSSSVNAFVANFKATGLPLHGLLNNAGGRCAAPRTARRAVLRAWARCPACSRLCHSSAVRGRTCAEEPFPACTEYSCSSRRLGCSALQRVTLGRCAGEAMGLPGRGGDGRMPSHTLVTNFYGARRAKREKRRYLNTPPGAR